jgi:hypothetical protein
VLFDYSIDESFKRWDKAPYAKMAAELAKDGKQDSELVLSRSVWEFRKQNKVLKAKAKIHTRCFKVSNELMADNGEKIKTLTPRIEIELNR